MSEFFVAEIFLSLTKHDASKALTRNKTI